ncbi:transmembrane gamma-carboxyglutamic acid protein 4 isoform X2 [Paroedura picta]|uniref:transmembrane gamma-carboxyglutamic acid protein 4 isoform X2 n=1 Tax=Paroedura picta TaxID=143630 RepID=UPI004056F25D
MRYRVMFIFYLLLLQLLQTLLGFPHYQRKLKVSKDAVKEVFMSAEQASSFIRRHPLNNVLEPEIFNTANLERECHEELCNYEEAREIFDDSEKMKTFWSEYVSRNSGRKPDGQEAQEIDVILLLTGLIAVGVLLVITGLLIYYLCKRKCPRRQTPRHTGCRLHNSSIFRRHEEFTLNPLSPCPEHTGLPTYEQAVALRGEHDAPPPPYPGLSGRFKAFKKSLSLPGP